MIFRVLQPVPSGSGVFASLALAGLALGLALCLIQSPQRQAQQFQAAGEAFHAKAQNAWLRDESSQYLLDLSRQALLRAAALSPRDPAVWVSLSSVLRDREEHDAARAAMNVALALDPQVPQPARTMQPALQLTQFIGLAGSVSP